VWNAIKDFFVAAWEAISGVVKTVWNGIKDFFTGLWDKIKSIFTTVLGTIKDTVSSVFTNIWNGIKNTVSNIVNSIKEGFNKAVDFVKNLASSAFTWGKDIIMGIVNGIKNCIGKVGDAVKSVADKIKSFLHFSVPDEGPLTDYESWMPDFMSGLAKGIEKSRYLVEKAVSGVASDMVITPRMESIELGNMSIGGAAVSAGKDNGIAAAITEALKGVPESTGDIVIPVYLGGTLLDEVIVSAQQRVNLRSGGR